MPLTPLHCCGQGHCCTPWTSTAISSHLTAYLTFYFVWHLVISVIIFKGHCYLSFSAFVLVFRMSYKSNTYQNVAIWCYLFLHKKIFILFFIFVCLCQKTICVRVSSLLPHGSWNLPEVTRPVFVLPASPVAGCPHWPFVSLRCLLCLLTLETVL